MNDIKFLTRKEVAALLRISLPTLYTWTKKEVLKSYNVEGRVYYDFDEVVKSIKHKNIKL